MLQWGEIELKLAYPPFAVNDLVTTDIISADAKAVRRVLRVRQDDDCLTGWSVDLSSGYVPCPHCRRVAPALRDLDSGWLKPAVMEILE